ncbi:MAG: DUF1572 family protein [Cytophagales bacterium]|nr:DUF1572 family protein [Cytophagales bacterium]
MNHTIDSLQTIFIRDLDKLADEIRQYPDEASVWKLSGAINNSGGNLCLHLCGNLQHFIGTVLGKSGYVRNRDAEFASRDIPRSTLLQSIDETKTAISKAMPTLTAEQLQAPYPQEVLGKSVTTIYFLIHLSAHLGYHLGQVNYHRRLLAV